MKPSRLASVLASPPSRRDFLTWLAAGPALGAVGCAAAQPSTGEPELLPGDADPLPRSFDAAEESARACAPTTGDATGPYYVSGAPLRGTRIASLNEPGVRLVVEGRLYGPDCKTPLAGYMLDLWQADHRGAYHDVPHRGSRSVSGETDYRLRGKVLTDGHGRYRFETVLPGRYADAGGVRPAHVHVRILTPGANELLTTQLYFEGDPYLGQADYCTRAGTCNAGDPRRILALADAMVSGTAGRRAAFDAFLARS